MKLWSQPPVPRAGIRLLVVLAVMATAAVPHSPAAATAQEATSPITVGQKYFMATHSFNVFIGPNRRTGAPGPLDRLAAEAGFERHENLGIQMIGGSTPMQHWNQGNGDDSQNLAKVALRAGGVDVFTMSPNALMPEEGVDLFGDLMIETNPTGRILVQNSWSAWDGLGTTPSVGGGGAPTFANADRDEVDVHTIESWIESLEQPGGYLERTRAQLAGINERAGRDMAFVVPSSNAVYRLRQEVARGNVPGIERQSELFVDAMGHANTPVVNLVSYVWFATMYRQSPAGMKALVDADDPTSADRELLLQQIAWNAVASEPMSGVVGEPVGLATR
jgi:hypothetical protein